jgi:hypothetical protein
LSLSAAQSHAEASLRAFRAHWQAVRQDWDDEVADRFEREYVEPLTSRVQRFKQACARFDEVLSQAEGDLA